MSYLRLRTTDRIEALIVGSFRVCRHKRPNLFSKVYLAQIGGTIADFSSGGVHSQRVLQIQGRNPVNDTASRSKYLGELERMIGVSDCGRAV